MSASRQLWCKCTDGCDAEHTPDPIKCRADPLNAKHRTKMSASDHYEAAMRHEQQQRDVPLRVGLRPEDGKIVDVGPRRHRVIWAGTDKPSVITYCNNCGGSVVLGPADGPDFCACGAPA